MIEKKACEKKHFFAKKGLQVTGWHAINSVGSSVMKGTTIRAEFSAMGSPPPSPFLCADGGGGQLTSRPVF
ncbi:MAG: hypothetical protein DRP83_04865 [Planctomycetota bacterium]|nr:MAG: hypothetical protein DRP83_04865 [Planctomycetota bacterium]